MATARSFQKPTREAHEGREVALYRVVEPFLRVSPPPRGDKTRIHARGGYSRVGEIVGSDAGRPDASAKQFAYSAGSFFDAVR